MALDKCGTLLEFLELFRCEHEPFLPAAECVVTLVGSHNEEHYFVATQDLDLRKKLRKVCVLAVSLVLFEVCASVPVDQVSLVVS